MSEKETGLVELQLIDRAELVKIIEKKHANNERLQAELAEWKAYGCHADEAALQHFKQAAALALQVEQMREALEGAYDYVEGAVNDYLSKYGETYKPQRLEYIRNVKASCDAALALSTQPAAEIIAAHDAKVIERCAHIVREKIYFRLPDRSHYQRIARSALDEIRALAAAPTTEGENHG